MELSGVQTLHVPIDIVGKNNSDEVLICGDFSLTYHSCAEVETYPFPKVEGLHEALRGCKVSVF